MKTGLLEIRPVFVRKESRTRGHVFCSMLALKLQREVERRLAAVFGTTDADRFAVTVTDAMASLSRLTLGARTGRRIAQLRIQGKDRSYKVAQARRTTGAHSRWAQSFAPPDVVCSQTDFRATLR